MESRDSQIYRTDQGQKTNVCKSRLKISFQTSMRVHKIDSQPALLYNSSCIFKVYPQHGGDGDQKPTEQVV